MAYLSIFAVLVACGLGVPLPEDISLILGGFLVYRASPTSG
jgi:membrane protein DedA with SNARE-associated domain